MSDEPQISAAVLRRRRARSRKLRLLARTARSAKREKIFNELAAGMSVERIAIGSGVSTRRMREIVQEILAARRADPADGFAQLQIARLSDAMMVAHTAMMEGKLEAVHLVVKLVHELERYHGSGAVDPQPVPRLALPEPLRALPAPGSAEAAENRAVTH